MHNHCSDITKKEFTAFQEGCEFSFRIIYDRYHQILYRYAFSIANDSFEAEEVIQETFIAFFKNRKRLDKASAIYPYLFTLTKRLLIMRFRSRVIKTEFNSYLKINWNESCNNTEEDLLADDLQSLLQECVDDLPPKQKEIYQLSKTGGLSYKEIAKFTGVSINTVKNHLIAASKKIKPKIEKYYLFFFFYFYF